MKILVAIGSLRAAAFSRKIGEAIASLAPDGVEVAITDGRDLPLYDQDLDGDEKPPAVQALLDQVGGCDRIVWVTPEFNYGIPGTLKNLVDWASRPAYDSPLKGKPSLVIAHSIAPSGGARAHQQLVAVLAGTLTPVLLAPGFTIGQVHEEFDESGALPDGLTKMRLERSLTELVAWAGSGATP